ncbi:hypothetical protein B566_EDAN013612 [Ephemera danica]|nr:hypothetical protein B566_EDAN013612 [Ephemera danica]
MAFLQLATLFAVVCAASAQQYGGYGQQGGYAAATHHEDYYAPPEYQFSYAVKDDHTKDIKQHKESRHGDKTEGEYSFLEADGTTRIVKYFVDGKSGFVAQVIREGHAVHAAPAPRVQHVVAAAPVYAKVVAPVAVHAAPVAVHAAPVYGHASSFQNTNVVRANAGGYSGFGAARGVIFGGNFGAARGGNFAGGYGGASSFVSGSNFGAAGNINRGGYGAF